MEHGRVKTDEEDGRAKTKLGVSGDDSEPKGVRAEPKDEGADKYGKDFPLPGFSDTADVKFRSRKRSQKIRVKHSQNTENETDADGDPEKGISSIELRLLKKAQLMREQSRESALDVRVEKVENHNPETDKDDLQASGDDVVGGLKDSFAIERSAAAIVERMDKYIEDGMRQKFGDREGANPHSQADKGTFEGNLYAIPERLQVNQRPLYDPGEGLPAAGVEEVELPAEVREKNIAETIRAHKELLAGKRSRDQNTDARNLPGNLSANFAKHRKDWITDRATSRHTSQDEAYCNKKGERSDFDCGQDDSDQGNGNALKKRRNYQVASDSLIAERFKKRWRR